VIHGRVPSAAGRLQASAVVIRRPTVIPVDMRCTEDMFELDAPLRHLSTVDGVCETQFVLSDGNQRWNLGRVPQPELYLNGLVTVPITVVALPGGVFMRLRVKSQADGELRVISERLPRQVTR
jgi:hypothetical protein